VAPNPPSPLEMKPLGKADFRNAIKDFYLTNPIARASSVMGELSAMAKGRAAQPLAAE
jgi:NADH-quinone oxidoreductase subunit G